VERVEGGVVVALLCSGETAEAVALASTFSMLSVASAKSRMQFAVSELLVPLGTAPKNHQSGDSERSSRSGRVARVLVEKNGARL
jgi:hypothetical protein